MTIRAIIFDLDGTLADTVPVCVQSFQDTIEHFRGSRPDPQEIYALFGTSEEGILERALPGRLEEALPYFLAVYEEVHRMCLQPFAGLDAAFTEIRRKQITTAIVTGKGHYSTLISMRVLGLDHYVQQVETGFQDRGNKPLSIQRVLSSSGIPPFQAVYVGDALSDMQAGKEAGVLPVGAAWAETSELHRLPSPPDFPLFLDIPTFVEWIAAI